MGEPPLTPAASADGDAAQPHPPFTFPASGNSVSSVEVEADGEEDKEKQKDDEPPKKKRRVALTRVGDL
jgi:chromatin assembly factor 1 subunit B